MTLRRLPPNRRPSITKALVYHGFKYYVTLGFYEDGTTPCDVFVSTTKQGTALSHIASDACILVSYILQTTGDLTELRGMLGVQQLNQGHLDIGGKDKHASIAGAIVELIFDHVNDTREERAQDVQETHSRVVPSDTKENDKQTSVNVARAQGYTGDSCTNCYGYRVKRNGSCLVCDDCGTTTGCS